MAAIEEVNSIKTFNIGNATFDVEQLIKHPKVGTVSLDVFNQIKGLPATIPADKPFEAIPFSFKRSINTLTRAAQELDKVSSKTYKFWRMFKAALVIAIVTGVVLGALAGGATPLGAALVGFITYAFFSVVLLSGEPPLKKNLPALLWLFGGAPLFAIYETLRGTRVSEAKEEFNSLKQKVELNKTPLQQKLNDLFAYYKKHRKELGTELQKKIDDNHNGMIEDYENRNGQIDNNRGRILNYSIAQNDLRDLQQFYEQISLGLLLNEEAADEQSLGLDRLFNSEEVVVNQA